MNLFYRLRNTFALSFILGLFSLSLYAQEGSIHGLVIDQKSGAGVSEVYVALKGTDFEVMTNDKGGYVIKNIPYGKYIIGFLKDNKEFYSEAIELQSKSIEKEVHIDISSKLLKEIVVSSYRKNRNKLEDICRLPIAPYKDLQSVHELNNNLIRTIGAIDVASVAENVSGVYTFATYGGIRESFSIRGLRGVPLLKNGILISKDIGGRGFATDMIGVENIQVVKGADAINMGEATSYGNAGGLINIVTKTPNFTNAGYVGMRLGTNNQYRPYFDIETTLGNNQNAAFRIDGAFESTRTYQNLKGIGKQSFYINPSLAFRPDEQTEIVLEVDHYNTTNSFDPGTVNQSLDGSTNELFKLPRNRYFGFTTDKVNQKMTTSSGRIKRYIFNDFYIRGAVFYANYNTGGPSTKLTPLVSSLENGINVNKNTLFLRSLQRHKEHSDQNFVAQLDFVGDHLKTGKLTHTFQAGIDFRSYQTTERKFNSFAIDTIDIHHQVSNQLPEKMEDFTLKSETPSTTRSFGFSAQEYLDIADRVKFKLGLRVGFYNSETPTSPLIVSSNYFNPFLGAMVRVWQEVNIFANYTHTTDPSTAQFLDINGLPLGNETFKQIETGIRSSWFNHQLRADLVYYRINNDGMNVQQTVVDENGVSQTLGHYFKGGHIRYEGVELDISGRLTQNLNVNAGFSKMKALYLKSDKFVVGSSPKNVPDWTINAQANYLFTSGTLKGLSIGSGYYYVGKRADNDWIQLGVEYHGLTPGLRPWDLNAYSQWKAYVGYDFGFSNNPTLKPFDVRVIGNNLTNNIGYTAYRDNNINLINPINAAIEIRYKL